MSRSNRLVSLLRQITGCELLFLARIYNCIIDERDDYAKIEYKFITTHHFDEVFFSVAIRVGTKQFEITGRGANEVSAQKMLEKDISAQLETIRSVLDMLDMAVWVER